MSPQTRDRRHIEVEPLPAITLGGARDEAQTTRWGLILVWYMRILACLWIIGGLIQWSVILGVGSPPGVDLFDEMPDALRLAIAFFAVIDMLAAIGLWLTAAWGGVVWIFAAISQIVLPLLAPEVGGLTGFAGQAMFAALIAIYFSLTFFAARERGDP